jgi:ribosomal protein L18
MVSLANRFFDAGVGIRYAVATGNEADLTVVDALEYLADEGACDALVLLVEEVRDGSRFVALGQRLLQLGRPLVAYKLGRTAEGGAAARSHTGALAGSYPTFRAVCRQLGVLETTEIDDVIDLAAAATARRWPRGPGIGIVTGSGGGGAAAADRAAELGLTVPSFGEASLRALSGFLPGFTAGTVENPFDATAQIIDDLNGVTIAAASSLEGEKGKKAKGSDVAAAALIGKLIAERAIEKGVKDVVFDRGGYIYHGRVKALADAAREAGLNF